MPEVIIAILAGVVAGWVASVLVPATGLRYILPGICGSVLRSCCFCERPMVRRRTFVPRKPARDVRSDCWDRASTILQAGLATGRAEHDTSHGCAPCRRHAGAAQSEVCSGSDADVIAMRS